VVIDVFALVGYVQGILGNVATQIWIPMQVRFFFFKGIGGLELRHAYGIVAYGFAFDYLSGISGIGLFPETE
jgi:hypothetical protein